MQRVLLIDDTKAVRAALQAALDPLGVEVDQAESGPAGLQKALTATWDLIFLDIEMPVMDGPTLLRILRARGVMTPVVLVTAVSSTPVLSAAIRLGAAHYISKPFTPVQIRGAAVKLLKLEPSRLDAPLPRVLVLSPDLALADELTARLPANVHVGTATALNVLLDQIGANGVNLVLTEQRIDGDGAEVAAAAARVYAPQAGIFMVRAGAPEERVWAPDGPIDGALRPHAPLSEFLAASGVRRGDDGAARGLSGRAALHRRVLRVAHTAGARALRTARRGRRLSHRPHPPPRRAGAARPVRRGGGRVAHAARDRAVVSARTRAALAEAPRRARRRALLMSRRAA
jgi:CheY-like chemotaxis protein